jgi:hypothetical protein
MTTTRARILLSRQNPPHHPSSLCRESSAIKSISTFSTTKIIKHSTSPGSTGSLETRRRGNCLTAGRYLNIGRAPPGSSQTSKRWPKRLMHSHARKSSTYDIRAGVSHIRYENYVAWFDWNAEWACVGEDMRRYQIQTIAGSIRIIQLPIASNIRDNSIRPEDGYYLRRALSALLSAKKAAGATRPHLRLLWDYEILAHELSREPIFNFEKSSQCQVAFTSVKIVAMCSKHPFWGLGKLHDECLYDEAWVEGIKDRLYELAEQWAKGLLTWI